MEGREAKGGENQQNTHQVLSKSPSWVTLCSVLSSCDYQFFLPSLFMHLIYLSAVWFESGCRCIA